MGQLLVEGDDIPTICPGEIQTFTIVPTNTNLQISYSLYFIPPWINSIKKSNEWERPSDSFLLPPIPGKNACHMKKELDGMASVRSKNGKKASCACFHHYLHIFK